MSVYRRCAAIVACTLPFASISPPSAVAAEELERLFVGTPTQLTLPPGFRDEPAQPDTGLPAGQECKAPGEQDTREQLDGTCSSETPVIRSSPYDGEPSPEVRPAERGAALAKSGMDSAKTQP
jgi:hypothetical protein